MCRNVGSSALSAEFPPASRTRRGREERGDRRPTANRETMVVEQRQRIVQRRTQCLFAGACVILPYGSANRGEKCFGNPEDFDMHGMSVGRYITFSRGVHYRLGAGMAGMQVRTVHGLLTTRLPNLRLSEEQAPVRLRHFILRGYNLLQPVWDLARSSTAVTSQRGHVKGRHITESNTRQQRETRWFSISV
jgi:hypothetical protein